jgi:hypothetical protein
MAASFLQSWATIWTSSIGAPALGTPPTMEVGLGETPPGDESSREVAQRWGDGATLSSGWWLDFWRSKGGGVIGETMGVVRKNSTTSLISNSLLQFTDSARI